MAQEAENFKVIGPFQNEEFQVRAHAKIGKAPPKNNNFHPRQI